MTEVEVLGGIARHLLEPIILDLSRARADVQTLLGQREGLTNELAELRKADPAKVPGLETELEKANHRIAEQQRAIDAMRIKGGDGNVVTHALAAPRGLWETALKASPDARKALMAVLISASGDLPKLVEAPSENLALEMHLLLKQATADLVHKRQELQDTLEELDQIKSARLKDRQAFYEQAEKLKQTEADLASSRASFAAEVKLAEKWFQREKAIREAAISVAQELERPPSVVASVALARRLQNAIEHEPESTSP